MILSDYSETMFIFFVIFPHPSRPSANMRRCWGPTGIGTSSGGSRCTRSAAGVVRRKLWQATDSDVMNSVDDLSGHTVCNKKICWYLWTYDTVWKRVIAQCHEWLTVDRSEGLPKRLQLSWWTQSWGDLGEGAMGPTSSKMVVHKRLWIWPPFQKTNVTWPIFDILCKKIRRWRQDMPIW